MKIDLQTQKENLVQFNIPILAAKDEEIKVLQYEKNQLEEFQNNY